MSGDRLSAFLDDELAEDDVMQAARHLSNCDRCLGELAALRSTRDALRRLPSLPAPELSAGIRVRAQRLARATRRVKLVLAVCTVPALLGAGVYVLGDDAGEVEPATESFPVEHLGRTGVGRSPPRSEAGEEHESSAADVYALREAGFVIPTSLPGGYVPMMVLDVRGVHVSTLHLIYADECPPFRCFNNRVE